LHETLFCYGKQLKFTYEHLQFQQISFGSLELAIQEKTKEGEGEGWEGKEGKGRGEEKGEGRGRGGRRVSPKQKPNSANEDNR
jgi:hypothetical protein